MVFVIRDSVMARRSCGAYGKWPPGVPALGGGLSNVLRPIHRGHLNKGARCHLASAEFDGGGVTRAVHHIERLFGVHVCNRKRNAAGLPCRRFAGRIVDNGNARRIAGADACAQEARINRDSLLRFGNGALRRFAEHGKGPLFCFEHPPINVGLES